MKKPWLNAALADLYLSIGEPIPARLLPPADRTWKRYEKEKANAEEKESDKILF